MSLLEAGSVWQALWLMMRSDGCSVLGVMKADVYAIAVGTVARGWRSIDGDYLFHVVVADGWW